MRGLVADHGARRAFAPRGLLRDMSLGERQAWKAPVVSDSGTASDAPHGGPESQRKTFPLAPAREGASAGYLSDLPAVLTVEECATVLRISRGSAYEGVRTGEIPAIKVGRTIRVPLPRLLELLGIVIPDPGINRETQTDADTPAVQRGLPGEVTV